MPEGDTIHRTASTLNRALGGRVVQVFESVFPFLNRVDEDQPLAGRRIEAVTAAGKHVLMHFSGDLTLRTHMRMSGSWHVYRPGERWWRHRSHLRIRVATDAFEAVAFDVHDAQFCRTSRLATESPVGRLGPDLLAEQLDVDAAVARCRASGEDTIADLLLDQRALAGIGNVYKCETLFLCGVDPWTPPTALSDDMLRQLVETARTLLRANVPRASEAGASPPPTTYRGPRRTTRRDDPEARLWVYDRAGAPCRRCGATIASRKGGPPYARTTYWCPRCQA